MELNCDKIKIKDLLDLKRNNMLTVNSEYQRGAVWKEAQQKKLIDSVLRGYPLPMIYLHHKKKMVAGMQREDLEVIDGQQRINSLYKFAEGSLKLFDPIKDDSVARFPSFIKNSLCPWAGKDFIGLEDEYKQKFNDTELFIVKVTTDNEDEARDLFIRLQAGLPLNGQEKRDAWPGNYTEFVLHFGGKKELVRYAGHDFFRKHIKQSSADRGEVRQLCAQIGMLFFENATKGNWLDIGTKPIDDYYYQNLDFDINSLKVNRLLKVLDLIVDLFSEYNGPKLKAHEAIHIVLLVNSLMDDYTRSWQNNFVKSFEEFKLSTAISTKERNGEFWFSYGSLTRTAASSPRTIQMRHSFFSRQMMSKLDIVSRDENRLFGELEREIIYFRDDKKCAVCKLEVGWDGMEIHHIDEHQNGGSTTLDNGVVVHKECHPKGKDAIDFYDKWFENKFMEVNVSLYKLLNRNPSAAEIAAEMGEDIDKITSIINKIN